MTTRTHPGVPVPPHKGEGEERNTPRAVPEEHARNTQEQGTLINWRARLEEQMEQLRLSRAQRRAMRTEFAAMRKAGLERRHRAKQDHINRTKEKPVNTHDPYALVPASETPDSAPHPCPRCGRRLGMDHGPDPERAIWVHDHNGTQDCDRWK